MFTVIANATDPNLVINTNDTYTVQITECKGCSTTSAALSLTAFGMNDMVASYNVRLYPNPNSGSFVLQLFTDEEVREVEITDALGRTMMTSSNLSSSIGLPLAWPD